MRVRRRRRAIEGHVAGLEHTRELLERLELARSLTAGDIGLRPLIENEDLLELERNMCTSLMRRREHVVPRDVSEEPRQLVKPDAIGVLQLDAQPAVLLTSRQRNTPAAQLDVCHLVQDLVVVVPVTVAKWVEEVHLVVRVIFRDPLRVLVGIGSLRRGLTIGIVLAVQISGRPARG